MLSSYFRTSPGRDLDYFSSSSCHRKCTSLTLLVHGGVQALSKTAQQQPQGSGTKRATRSSSRLSQASPPTVLTPSTVVLLRPAKGLGNRRGGKRTAPETESGVESGSPRHKRRLNTGTDATAIAAAEPGKLSDSTKSQSAPTGDKAPLVSSDNGNCQDASPKGGIVAALAAAAAAMHTDNGSDTTKQPRSPLAADSLGSADAPRFSGAGAEEAQAEAAAGSDAAASAAASDPAPNSQSHASPKSTVGSDNISAEKTGGNGESPHPESPTAQRRVRFASGTTGPEVTPTWQLLAQVTPTSNMQCPYPDCMSMGRWQYFCGFPD